MGRLLPAAGRAGLVAVVSLIHVSGPSPCSASSAAAPAPVALDAANFDRIGSMSVLICPRVSGPRRYDIAQRDWNTTGWLSCTLFMRNTRLPRPASVASIWPRLNDEPAWADAPSSPS